MFSFALVLCAHLLILPVFLSSLAFVTFLPVALGNRLPLGHVLHLLAQLLLTLELSLLPGLVPCSLFHCFGLLLSVLAFELLVHHPLCLHCRFSSTLLHLERRFLLSASGFLMGFALLLCHGLLPSFLLCLACLLLSALSFLPGSALRLSCGLLPCFLLCPNRCLPLSFVPSHELHIRCSLQPSFLIPALLIFLLCLPIIRIFLSAIGVVLGSVVRRLLLCGSSSSSSSSGGTISDGRSLASTGDGCLGAAC
mmetsp:Transcript_118549/g.308004  ORF Transcript_118549/g.308004 Transcript_118549/m.308004 type:complete len:252 (-) Transcript_118549:1121-1876(-)